MNKPFKTPGTTRPMRSEAVRFHNGMIVTDTDLMAAMTYSVQLLATTNRAVHGCGVACGFWFRPDPDTCGATRPCDPCGDDNEPRKRAHPGFKIEVQPGSAIDCYGLPMELCEPVLVDLSPETCGCDSAGGTVCIAARRVSSDEAPRGDCCSDSGQSAACTRVRDHIELRAFTEAELPDHICRREAEKDPDGRCGCGGGTTPPDPQTGYPGSDRYDPDRDNDPELADICRCLMTCAPCECCGEGWVLLGCVELCPTGVVVQSFEPGSPVYAQRRWIKTIECICQPKRSRKREETSDKAKREETREQLVEDYRAMGLDDQSVAMMQIIDPADLQSAISFLDANKPQLKLALGLKTQSPLTNAVKKGREIISRRSEG